MTQQASDAQRLLTIDRALREIAGDHVLPRVALTDSTDSWVLPGVRRRRARLWVSRRSVDAGPVALRGELAHEYAHLVDPNHWRDALRAITGWAALTLLAVTGWATPMLLTSTRAAEISIVAIVMLWAAGWLCIACACWWFARISHRRELRADRSAAQLLGDVAPVLVMIDDVRALHSQRPRRQRAFARLTHPDPQRRHQALLALALKPGDPGHDVSGANHGAKLPLNRAP